MFYLKNVIYIFNLFSRQNRNGTHIAIRKMSILDDSQFAVAKDTYQQNGESGFFCKQFGVQKHDLSKYINTLLLYST